MVLAIVAAALIAVGAGLLWAGRRAQAKTNLITGTPASPVAEIGRLLPGELVEVSGTLRSERPLTGEVSGRPCAWCSTQVIREYEERERDSDGHWRTTRGSETISSRTQVTDAQVEDGTGRVTIHLDGAEIDALKVADRFEREAGRSGGGISLGGISLPFGDGGRRTLGYRHVESILPLDAPVYVLGAVREDGAIGAPSSGSGGRFIVSYRSEEELVRHWVRRAQWLGYGAVALFAAGVALLVIALVLLVV